MKNLFKTAIFTAFLLITSSLKGQVLITLLLGDALNSEKIEFGLVGGMTRSYITDISDAKGLNSFNLGFYFHILMKNNSYLSTGVLVKSNLGATGMATYSMGDPSFDEIYKDGSLTKRINCFQVPVLFHQRFNNRWYIEAGPKFGLIFKPVDIFEAEKLGGDLSFTIDTKDQYKKIDFGLLAGAGYKFQKKTKSMSAGINYYYGLVDVSNNPAQEIKNSAVYFYIKIPIGAGEKKE